MKKLHAMNKKLPCCLQDAFKPPTHWALERVSSQTWLQLSELWKGNKPNYLIGFLPLSLRTERNHWESRIRVNNEQKRKKKKISLAGILRACLSAKQRVSLNQQERERPLLLKDDFKYHLITALGIPPFGKRSRELTLSRNGVKFIREREIKRRFQSFPPVTTRHPCRGAAGHLLPRGCSGNW